ncbi:threonine aldolase family protein [Flavihumibacter solisilvae]|uniref:Aromatic amino acid beta-eliminating lyase/threonine aldolase domain-containing protein n=1 Tax=Flavihumibacter solisilvae TaxID=1349421 RepID=A0A0C1L7D7_9BACT|nr:aminotransferase class I/II-fold pyridoxal phosphate-dependent enzyme [Flavihumibacter solisilvae]KIC95426.1 hypothetical protein OI18_05905 [Flavihumibacter solisilvae]
MTTSNNRRNFLKTAGSAIVPVLMPAGTLFAATARPQEAPAVRPVRFFGDGETFEPEDYINELAKLNAKGRIERDRYGTGGVVAALEKKFTEITGKESAIFMPSGTMANQLAIAVLSGESSKVFVQDTSHVFRDEADAAQSVFSKRLYPLAPGETYFTARQLQDTIESLPNEEVFRTGIGAVSIENPVRRTDGRQVPIDEIRKISTYCRSNNIKLHLDGARLFMASAWSGVPIKEYASHFDTVYVSLYKYFGASAGAVLCGSKDVIGKMGHLVKVHGGSMYSNWANAAMALHRLDGFEERLQSAVRRSEEIFASLNKIPGIRVSALSGGTNIYTLELAKEIDGRKLQEKLNKEFNVRMPRPNDKGQGQLMVNETLLYQSADYVIDAFRKSIR